MNKRNVLTFFILAFIIFALLLTIIQVKKRQLYQKKAAVTTPGRLYLTTANSTVSLGQTFDVDIILSTGGLNTIGTSIVIIFDRQYFEVMQVIPGKDLSQPNMYPRVLKNQVINNQIHLSAAVDLPNRLDFNGQGIFGRIKFKVKETAPLRFTPLSFRLINPSFPAALGDCDIISLVNNKPQDILGQVNSLALGIRSTGLTPNPVSTGSINPVLPTITNSPTPTITLTPTPTLPVPIANPTIGTTVLNPFCSTCNFYQNGPYQEAGDNASDSLSKNWGQYVAFTPSSSGPVNGIRIKVYVWTAGVLGCKITDNAGTTDLTAEAYVNLKTGTNQWPCLSFSNVFLSANTSYRLYCRNASWADIRWLYNGSSLSTGGAYAVCQQAR